MLRSGKTGNAGKRRFGARGFTIIELMVVVAIMVLITGIVLYNYKSYGVQTALSDAANEIALTIREAQVYATSVRGYTPPGETAPNFDTAYGVYFTPKTNFNGSYVLYANPDNGYDAKGHLLYTGVYYAPENETILRRLLPPGYTISEICVGSDPASMNCDSDKHVTTANPTHYPKSISVLFTKTYATSTISAGTDALQYQYAEIHIKAPNGSEKVVAFIRANGYAYVK